MTIGEIAGLIAALAFVALVIFIGYTLLSLRGIFKEVNETVKKMNTTIDVVTKDVDNLSIEVEGLLNKANTLVDDVNGKLGKTDPLFVAIGDLGHSVSDLNDSTKQMTSNIVSSVTRKKKKKNPFSSLTKLTKPKTKKHEEAFDEDTYSEEVVGLSEEKLPIESDLFSISTKTPSTTAGEISINNKGVR